MLYILILIYFFLLLLMYALSYITIDNNRDNLYYKLKEKERNLIKGILEKQRQQVLSTFESNSEMELTTRSVSEFENLDPETKKLLNNITSGKDLKSLIAYAEYQIRIKDYEKALSYFNKAIELEPNNIELWRRKLDVLNLTNHPEEKQKVQVRYNELYKTKQFNDNLTHQILLKSVELNDISIYGSLTWHFRKNINILLGKNGYGKSHLMGIILAILQEEEKTARNYTSIDNSGSSLQPYVKIRLSSDYTIKKDEIDGLKKKVEEKVKLKTDFISDWRKSQKTESKISMETKQLPNTEIDDEIYSLLSQIELLEGISNFNRVGLIDSFGKIPMLAIPDSRFINKSNDFTLPVIDERAKKLLGNGAYHFIYDVPYENAIQNFLNTICVIYTDESNPSKKFNDPIFHLINRVFKSLTGHEFNWREIKRTQDNSGFIIIVRSEGSTIDIPIQKVSQGTLSVLSMFGLIFQYLSLRYPDSDRKILTKKHSIVFIDEIDAHLHPNWQQKIIRILRNEFPNIQFIISAHSPLIIAGCKEEEVSVLRKKGNGFEIETIETNLIGKPIADIFKMVFEIEEKDEMYLEISALLPFRKSIEKEAALLAEKSRRNAEEQKRFDELNLQIEKFIYVDQFSSLISGNEEKESLRQQNEEMKMELLKLNAQLKNMEQIKIKS